jgi:hypothetical protein
MKTSIAVLALALAFAAAVAAGGAGANGSPYSPGLVYGGDGVLARDAGVRYVTLTTEKSTLVSVIRRESGHVERWRLLRGFYGIPLVAYDGTSGGLSGNGKRLVVGSYGPLPGNRGITRFAVLDTKSLKLRRSIALDGSWSFDAISPDGSTVYLTQHITAGTNPVYRVRPFDVRTGLLRGAIVDRLEGEEEMGGEPVTRASSADGRWAYTLYARTQHEPFIHALDTAKKEAFCIDLPLQMTRDEQWALRLRLLERSGQLSVRQGRRTLASVDTRSFDVEDQKS